MKIYYAHHLWKYGTKIERYEMALIRRSFPNCELFNPSTDIKQGQAEKFIMQECFEQIKSSDALAFSSLSGVVGKGVYQEINIALHKGIPIFYLYNNSVIPISNFEWILANESDRVYAVLKLEDSNGR